MAESNGQTDRYPSPAGGPIQGLPFYQSTQSQPQHHPERRTAPSPQGAQETEQRERTSASPSSQLRGEASGESQMRSSLIGSTFGNFGAPTANMGSRTAASEPTSPEGAPQGSVAYAQYTGSPGAAPPSVPLAGDKKDKRQKVSRACDECRRKKIRCDAVDETGSTPCTNCARTGAKCAFSRQPMKRGPSKGYIKELADRLHTLERQVHPPHMQEQHQYEIQQVQRAMAEGLQAYGHDPRVVVDARTGEKRTHDMAEAMQNGQTQMLPPGSAIAQHSGMHAYGHPPPQQSAPGATQPFWRYGGGLENRQEPAGLTYESENATTITNFDWDEAVIDEYYRIIHQTFPLLPHNKHRLRQRLGECPASLREACLAALDCLMRTFPTTSLPPNTGYAQALKRTAELLAQYPFDNPSSHTNATNLVYLQTLILMALESDNHGPATIRGQAGPSRAEWLGRAAGVAGQLEINVIRNRSTSVMEGDRDSEERLARRVWWVLFILDRWHASSTADLLKLPENSVVLLPEDQVLLGESTYHLARLSFIIGHLAAILTTTKTPSTDVMAPSNPASSLLGLTLAGEIDRFRESVESVWGSLNLVHLSYHHCHLLIKRLNPTTEPSELVGHAVKVATVLNSRLTPVTPLNHHFGALAAMTLCELSDVPKTRTEAIKGLDQMAECLGEGRGLAGKLESEGWDGAVRELVVKKREKMQQYRDGLHNLADAAVGGDDANFDPTMLTRYGYLTSLGQGLFGRESV
ncbi:transcriptional regulatory [Lecanosticta acicola]|uniref:Transcriptional regulatory n=1 Tax=Lecanosticta acicola TaxID=111012 RepID=A0AAI8Z2G7_9PEZI|nr:transcriptional regulatory [Lecanosticta acicola]